MMPVMVASAGAELRRPGGDLLVGGRARNHIRRRLAGENPRRQRVAVERRRRGAALPRWHRRRPC